MKREDFIGAGSEELRTVVDGNRAMTKGYQKLRVVASEREEVWGPRDRECSLWFERDFFNTGWRI